MRLPGRKVTALAARPRTLLLMAAVLAGAAGAWPSAGAEAGPDVVRVAVTFEVDNVNRSAVPCASDQGRYEIAGHVTGPVDLLLAGDGAPAATLYLHEFSFGGFFWAFDGVAGYDYATALARAGHVSVVVDRLGYDGSGHPLGSETCLGAQADSAAQIVRHLQRGTYEASSAAHPGSFQAVLLAGHSVGGGIAELAAHSFPDLDVAGLLLFAWADQGYSPRSVEQALQQANDCLRGGEPAYADGPGGYAYFGRTDADFQRNVFHAAEPEVVAQVTALRNRDPCGDNATLARMAAVNAASVGDLAIPVLLVFGDEDAVFLPGAAETQAALLRSSPGVTVHRLPGTGHALTLERTAAEVSAVAARWLGEHAPATLPTPDPSGAEGGRPDNHDDAVPEGVAVLIEQDLSHPRTGAGWFARGGALLALLALHTLGPRGSRRNHRLQSGHR